jgi:glutathione peroxidase
MTLLYDFEVHDIDGRARRLADYAGQALLVVNVASQCGFTPQYQGLELLYRRYRNRGFEVLGFPCDQFGHQEPGDEAEIRSFCSMTYDISFPLFQKIEVNGTRAHPLYRHLKAAAPGLLGMKAIKWNFTKFLVDGRGRVVRRYGPADRPESLALAVEALLSPRAGT